MVCEGRSQNKFNGEIWDWWFFGYKKVVVSHEKIGRLIVLSKCYGWEKWRNE